MLQLLLLGGVAYALGWDPQGSVLTVLLLVVAGTAAFSGLGLLLGGTLRGLTCLAVANLAWLLLLVLGGVMFDLEQFGPAEPVLRLLPSAALSDGLRATLRRRHGCRSATCSRSGRGRPARSRWPPAAFRWE